MAEILQRPGIAAENWQARLRKLDKGRLFGRCFAAGRSTAWGTQNSSLKTFLRRTAKIAVHETWHMLGIWHCTHCRLSGSPGNRSLACCRKDTPSDKPLVPQQSIAIFCDVAITGDCLGHPMRQELRNPSQRLEA